MECCWLSASQTPPSTSHSCLLEVSAGGLTSTADGSRCFSSPSWETSKVFQCRKQEHSYPHLGYVIQVQVRIIFADHEVVRQNFAALQQTER